MYKIQEAPLVTQSHIDQARKVVAEAVSARVHRLLRAARISHDDHLERCDRIWREIAENARKTYKERGNRSLVPLCDDDLMHVERQVIELVREGRVHVFDRHPEIHDPLDLLRLNLHVQKGLVPPPAFRRGARDMMATAIPLALRLYQQSGMLDPEVKTPLSLKNVVVVLPWRAPLVAGRLCKEMGAEHFWHLRVSRDERELTAGPYHDPVPDIVPPEYTRDWVHLALDHMNATNKTGMYMHSRMLEAGVNQRRIVSLYTIASSRSIVASARANPNTFQAVAAWDSGLNDRGFIEPGLGDWGDLSFADATMDADYIREWIASGFITAKDADLFCRRSQGSLLPP